MICRQNSRLDKLCTARPTPVGRWAGVVLSIMMLTCPVIGCAARPPADPRAAILDRDIDPARRLRTLEQLGAVGSADDAERYRATLHGLVWSDAQPVAMRRLAIDRLLEDDAEAFWAVCDRRIVEVDDWDVLGHVFDRAVEANRRGFVRTAAVSLARPSQVYADRDRPELAVISRLSDGAPATEALFDLFDAPRTADIEPRHRIAAWTALSRLLEPDALRRALSRTRSNTWLANDLRSGAVVLDRLPDTPQAIAWLTYARHSGPERFWARAREAAAALPEHQQAGLAMRHLPVLVGRQDVVRDEAARAALRSKLDDRLALVMPTQRTDRRAAQPGYSERWADHRNRLAWADLLVIDTVLDAIDRPRLAAELFRQADADLADTTTEHGGVLDFDTRGYRAIAFAADFTDHDRRFIAPPELLQRMFTGIAHYHFHAQAHDNTAYAGPGAGDQAFIDRFGATAVLLTFLDRDRLNVDYCQPDGVVIDLGDIRRPR